MSHGKQVSIPVGSLRLLDVFCVVVAAVLYVPNIAARQIRQISYPSGTWMLMTMEL